MDRRAFIASALLAAAPPFALAGTPVTVPVTAVRAFATVDPARGQPESLVARVDRLTSDSPPFPDSLDALVEIGHFRYLGAMRGEYSVGEVAPVPAPAGLALTALFADFISSAGIVGFRQEHTLGMIESDRFRWTIQSSGGARRARVTLLGELALALAERSIRATPAPGSDGLWDLLPTLADLPLPTRIAHEGTELPPA